MERILIIGISGSGKSTFAKNLGEKLNREVIHLDSAFRRSERECAYQTLDEWKQAVRDLASEDKWIMDGHYRSTLDTRIQRADTIIYFNFNKLLCIYRVCKRVLKQTQPFSKPEGNLNYLTYNLVRKLIMFPKKKVLKMLEQCKDTKKVFVIKNDKEVEELLIKLTETPG